MTMQSHFSPEYVDCCRLDTKLPYYCVVLPKEFIESFELKDKKLSIIAIDHHQMIEVKPSGDYVVYIVFEDKMKSGDPIECDNWFETEFVVYSRLNAGYPYDQENARKYLIPNNVYSVNKIKVWAAHSEVELKELPDIWFNTVLFEPKNKDPRT